MSLVIPSEREYLKLISPKELIFNEETDVLKECYDNILGRSRLLGLVNELTLKDLESIVSIYSVITNSSYESKRKACDTVWLRKLLVEHSIRMSENCLFAITSCE